MEIQGRGGGGPGVLPKNVKGVLGVVRKSKGVLFFVCFLHFYVLIKTCKTRKTSKTSKSIITLMVQSLEVDVEDPMLKLAV